MGFDPSAHADDEALQRGNARQQNLVGQQPSGGAVEQRTQPLSAGPAHAVKPTRHSQAHSRFGDVTVAVTFADLCYMLLALFSLAIALQTVEGLNSQLV